MATIHKQDGPGISLVSFQTGEVVARGAIVAILCVISYWLITHMLANTYSISRDDDFLGGMWAVVATIFVYRESNAESVRFALSRMAATSVSRADRDRRRRRDDNGPSGRYNHDRYLRSRS
jgi:hypothetical protein